MMGPIKPSNKPYQLSDRYQGSKKVHEGRKAAKESRRKPVYDIPSERKRLLRLGKTAAKKMIEGTMQRNKAKKK